MTKQEQIEEMRRALYCAMSKVSGIASSSDLAEALYNAGYGNVSEYRAERELLGSQINIEVDNLIERLKAQEREIVQLKAENARLTGRLGQVLLAVDTVKEMNAMCDIDEQRQQAVKEFVGKIKAKLNAIYGKTICSDLDTEDITDIIDELLEEV